jgi:hypothetical protein
LIPRYAPYATVSAKEIACVTDSWDDGDPFEEIKWHHMTLLLSSVIDPWTGYAWRGQEFPDIFDVVEGKVKPVRAERPKRRLEHRQTSLFEKVKVTEKS